MVVRWVKRILTRKRRKPVSSGRVSSRRPSAAPVIKRPSKTLFRQYSHELETSFYASILETSADSFIKLSEKQKVDARKVAQFLVQHTLTLDKLPRRPASLPMLIKILKIDELPYAKISEILLNDPSLTTKILTMVNTPYFRANNKEIDTLEQSVLLMGTSGLKKVISAAIMEPVFADEGQNSTFSQKVWEWALLVAGANDKFWQAQGEEEGKFFLLGLLPALAIILVHRAIDEFESEHAQGRPLHPSLRKAIVKQLSWNICLAIRKQWGLPQEYDAYIKAAQKPIKEGAVSPLRDAMVLATHVFLEKSESSPLNVPQLTSLTAADVTKVKAIIAAQSAS